MQILVSLVQMKMKNKIKYRQTALSEKWGERLTSSCEQYMFLIGLLAVGQGRFPSLTNENMKDCADQFRIMIKNVFLHMSHRRADTSNTQVIYSVSASC